MPKTCSPTSRLCGKLRRLPVPSLPNRSNSSKVSGGVSTAEKYSREQQEFLNVWDKLYPTYRNFKAKLTAENLCYEGMGQRLFCERLSHHHTDKQLIFAGFNALNQCEKKIFTYFRDNGQASFYWDYDLYYSANENHEAGLYIRENMKLFPNALGLEHFNNLRYNNKDVEYISVPSTIGQAKLIPTLVGQLHPRRRRHTRTRLSSFATKPCLPRLSIRYRPR